MNGTFHREHKFIIDNNLSHYYGNTYRPHLQVKKITKIWTRDKYTYIKVCVKWFAISFLEFIITSHYCHLLCNVQIIFLFVMH